MTEKSLVRASTPRSLRVDFPQVPPNLPIKSDALNNQTIKLPSPPINSISKLSSRPHFLRLTPFPGASSDGVFTRLTGFHLFRHAFPLRQCHGEEFGNLVLSKVIPFVTIHVFIHRHKTKIVMVLR